MNISFKRNISIGLYLISLYLIPTILHSQSNIPTITISYFDNTSKNQKFKAFSKGLADMLVSDLSKIKLFNLVEREKYENLVNEINLGKSEYIDKTTAQKMGKLLGAQYILTGAFISITPEIRIDAKLIEVETGRIVMTSQVSGKDSEIFKLENDLANQLISSFEENKIDSRIPLKNIQMKLSFYEQYSKSLDHLDNGLISQAKEELNNLNNEQPEIYYASEKYELIKKAISISDEKREIIISNNINKIRNGIDITSKTFYAEVNQAIILFINSKKNKECLKFIEYLYSLKHPLHSKMFGENSPVEYGEMIGFQEIQCNYNLMRYDKVIQLGQAFLAEYTVGQFYTSTKYYMELILDRERKIKEGLVSSEENIKIYSINDFNTEEEFIKTQISIYELYMQYKKTISCYYRLIELTKSTDDQKAKYYYHIAKLYLEIGDFDKSIEVIMLISKKFPQSKYQIDALTLLKSIPE